MNDTLLIAASALSGLAVILLIAVLLRLSKGSSPSDVGLKDEFRLSREESAKSAQALRQEIGTSIQGINKTLIDSIHDIGEKNERSMDRVRQALNERVKELQESNEKKLEEMRKTVDEKLHETLEKRLSESFKNVSEELQKVYTGLGEMKNLATGVGDLKKVLTNVKSRGTWAEVQLGALLEQVLTPAQFEKNVKVVPTSDELVEFAVKLPGPDGNREACVWLPIDSKFPQEDYVRLQDAAENGDKEEVKRAENALKNAIEKAAKDIATKYIAPPHSTDFAIMFLGTEGLYAEALRIPGLTDSLQQKYRVVIAGPTTISAILNSLRMGFQALAFEQRASEVWRVLGAVKTEFGKFGTVLERVKKQLQTVSNTIDQTGVRTRAIQKSLTAVSELPGEEATDLLAISTGDIDDLIGVDEESELES